MNNDTTINYSSLLTPVYYRTFPRCDRKCRGSIRQYKLQTRSPQNSSLLLTCLQDFANLLTTTGTNTSTTKTTTTTATTTTTSSSSSEETETRYIWITDSCFVRPRPWEETTWDDEEEEEDGDIDNYQRFALHVGLCRDDDDDDDDDDNNGDKDNDMDCEIYAANKQEAIRGFQTIFCDLPDTFFHALNFDDNTRDVTPCPLEADLIQKLIGSNTNRMIRFGEMQFQPDQSRALVAAGGGQISLHRCQMLEDGGAGFLENLRDSSSSSSTTSTSTNTTTLQSLDIFEEVPFSPQVWSSFWTTPFQTRLESLSLYGLKLNTILCHGFDNAQHLNLHHCVIQKASSLLRLLLAPNNKSPTVLRLDSCRIVLQDDTNTTTSSSSSSSTPPSAASDNNDNHHHHHHHKSTTIRMPGLEQQAATLPQQQQQHSNKHLQRLAGTDLDKAQIQVLIHALPHLVALSSLDVEFEKLPTATMMQLFQAISLHPTLQDVRLKQNCDEENNDPHDDDDDDPDTRSRRRRQGGLDGSNNNNNITKVERTRCLAELLKKKNQQRLEHLYLDYKTFDEDTFLDEIYPLLLCNKHRRLFASLLHQQSSNNRPAMMGAAISYLVNTEALPPSSLMWMLLSQNQDVLANNSSRRLLEKQESPLKKNGRGSRQKCGGGAGRPGRRKGPVVVSPRAKKQARFLEPDTIAPVATTTATTLNNR